MCFIGLKKKKKVVLPTLYKINKKIQGLIRYKLNFVFNEIINFQDF